jgi:CheY-like chemotaxis protein/predicted  nucleic acid-binding Zn-ribbon protein
MAQRILLLESDSAFAEGVRSQLVQRGAEVEVLADGDQGVARAAANPPALVLLTVELPGTNGFLVCKRLRKTPGLAEVPIIILSSDVNADEIFEQHRKLRTRANDYLRKPVDPATVVAAVGQLVPLGGSAMERPAISEEPILLDEVEVDSGTPEDALPTGTRAAVDDEIEAFAESAFDSLIVPDGRDGQGQSLAEQPAYTAPAAPPVPGTAADVPGEPSATGQPAPTYDQAPLPGSNPGWGGSGDDQGAAASPAPPPAPAPVDDGRLAALETELAQAQRRAADADRFEREVGELRAQLERGGAASNRELLDLREQLNGKDRELLDLRDQLSTRDKELLASRNESLQLGRTIADHEDKILGLERQLAAEGDRARQLDGDKAEALRRIEDLEARLRQAEGTASDLEQRLDESRAELAREKERLGREHEAATTGLREEHAAAISGLREEHGAELRRRDEDLERRLREADRQREDALSEAAAAKDQALGELRRELDDRRERELAELREEHQQELSVLGGRLSDTESELARTREQLTQSKDEASDLSSRLSAMTSARDELEGQLGQARGAIADLERHRDTLRGELDTLRRKVSDDAALLDRARKALAIGLGLLEDQRTGGTATGEAAPQGPRLPADAPRG